MTIYFFSICDIQIFTGNLFKDNIREIKSSGNIRKDQIFKIKSARNTIFLTKLTQTENLSYEGNLTNTYQNGIALY